MTLTIYFLNFNFNYLLCRVSKIYVMYARRRMVFRCRMLVQCKRIARLSICCYRKEMYLCIATESVTLDVSSRFTSISDTRPQLHDRTTQTDQVFRFRLLARLPEQPSSDRNTRKCGRAELYHLDHPLPRVGTPFKLF
jgi:hypothetical protein